MKIRAWPQNYADLNNCNKYDKEDDVRWEKREKAMGADRDKQAFEATRQEPFAEKENRAVAQNYAQFGKIDKFDNFKSSEVTGDKEQNGAREKRDSSGESQFLGLEKPEKKLVAQNYAKIGKISNFDNFDNFDNFESLEVTGDKKKNGDREKRD